MLTAWPIIVFNGPTPGLFLFIFVLFKHKFYMLQRDLNSGRWSRRWASWPLDHHHGPTFNNFLPKTLIFAEFCQISSHCWWRCKRKPVFCEVVKNGFIMDFENGITFSLWFKIFVKLQFIAPNLTYPLSIYLVIYYHLYVFI